MAQIDSPQVATRLVHAIATDILLYNESEIELWLHSGSMPEPLAEAIREGNGLFVQRVSHAIDEGGRFFCNGLLSVLQEKMRARGGLPPDRVSAVERALGLASAPIPQVAPIAPVDPYAAAQPYAVANPCAAPNPYAVAGAYAAATPQAPAAPAAPVAPVAHADPRGGSSLVVSFTSTFGGGTLSFFDRALVVERAGLGGATERVELAYADVEALQVGRGPSGCELAVRVRYAEHRFTLQPADAIAVGQRLLPFVVGAAR